MAAQICLRCSNVEINYGANEWAKEMAQKLIDDQTKEIADMTGWLKESSK